ncbi:MAG: hypothetical protein ABEJ83_01360 [Candidatus Nanohaloarchaea archaeon]
MGRNDEDVRKQLNKAKEMLGIPEDRADEIFNDDTNHKQEKRKKREQE